MTKSGGTKRVLLTTLVGVFVALMVIPMLGSFANAAPAPQAAASPAAAQQWAYGGEAWQNGTVILSNSEYTYSAFFGWTVVLTSTPTSANILSLEAQRTMATTLVVNYCAPQCSSPTLQATYNLKAQEADAGFANVTNQSTVYESGVAVPAVGLLNDSASSHGQLSEILQVTTGGQTATRTLTATGNSNSSIAFSPGLGLIPLNLSAANTWNSTAQFSAQGAWLINYAWSATTLSGVSSTGMGSVNGTVQRSGEVNLTGYVLGMVHLRDQTIVPAILLVIQGPFDDYDGFILVPHAYNMFGGAAHGYDSYGLGGANVASSSVDGSIAGGQFHPTAASASFGASASDVSPPGTSGGSSPGANYGSPGEQVQAQPMSVVAAQQESSCLTNGCGGSAASALPIIPILVIGLVVAAVIGTVSVTEWRVYARRKKQQELVGGYSAALNGGLPPARAAETRIPEGPAGEAPAGPQEQPPRAL
ncbi:MAG: hypothetical protein WB778_06140 [Thermoplasmata archaeon]